MFRPKNRPQALRRMADDEVPGTPHQPHPFERNEMKISSILTVAALSSLFAMGAGAEEYQGVLKFNSTASRAEVRAQAVTAAHSADPYREAAFAGVAPRLVNPLDRTGVRAEAVAIARAGNPYGEVASAGVSPRVAGNVDRRTVQAEARATAARGVTEGS